MIRAYVVGVFACAMALAMVCLTPSFARAQTLTIEVELADLETFITNNTPAPIQLGLYELKSPAHLLDPVHWRSIQDSRVMDAAHVSSTLGSGALSFSEFIGRTQQLIEVNFPSVGVWQPGTRWSIGFPFGTSPETFNRALFDGQFVYAGTGPPVVEAPIVFLVPEPAAISVAALAMGTLLRFRRRRACSWVGSESLIDCGQ
jgi:hypothetical protein